MIVFRLEHSETGLGPYTTKDGEYEDLLLQLSSHKAPGDFEEYWVFTKDMWDPEEDEFLPDEWLFAWESQAHMDDFICGVDDLMGFVVRQYEVDDYLILPDGQVMFNKLTAILRLV